MGANRQQELLKKSSEFLVDIKIGGSFFQRVPEEIGELKYVFTTKDCAHWDTEKKNNDKSAITIVALICIALILIFAETTQAKVVLTAFACVIWFSSILDVNLFEGVDYFVGTKGFYWVRFKKTRSNIIEKSIFCFEDASDLQHYYSHVRHIGRPSYDEFFFVFLRGREIVKRETYMSDNQAEEVLFYEKVFEAWNIHKNKDYIALPSEFGLCSINKKNVVSRLDESIILDKDYITIRDNMYLLSDIKEFGIKKKNFVLETKDGRKEKVLLTQILNFPQFENSLSMIENKYGDQ